MLERRSVLLGVAAVVAVAAAATYLAAHDAQPDGLSVLHVTAGAPSAETLARRMPTVIELNGQSHEAVLAAALPMRALLPTACPPGVPLRVGSDWIMLLGPASVACSAPVVSACASAGLLAPSDGPLDRYVEVRLDGGAALMVRRGWRVEVDQPCVAVAALSPTGALAVAVDWLVSLAGTFARAPL